MGCPDGPFIAGLDDMELSAWIFGSAFVGRPFLTADMALVAFFATFPILAVDVFFFLDAILAAGIFIPGMCIPGMPICEAAGVETAKSASALAAANKLVFTECLLRTEFAREFSGISGGRCGDFAEVGSMHLRNERNRSCGRRV